MTAVHRGTDAAARDTLVVRTGPTPRPVLAGTSAAEPLSAARELAHRLLPAEQRRRLRPVVAAGRRLRRGVRGLGGAPSVTRVAFDAWDAVAVSRSPTGARTVLDLRDGTAQVTTRCDLLVVEVGDVGALQRLGTAGLLRGSTGAVEVVVAALPREHRVGLVLPRPRKVTTSVTWEADEGGGARLRVGWSQRRDVTAALQEVCAGLVRAGSWDQAGGPLFGIDRSADLDGVATWPAGVLVAEPVPARPSAERPTPLSPPRGYGLRVSTPDPVMTGTANPYGRVLAGLPQRYLARQDTGWLELLDGDGRSVLTLSDRLPVESALAGATATDRDPPWAKFCAVEVDHEPADRFGVHALRALACCGVVLVAADPAVRHRLAALDLLAVDPRERAELEWYRLSVDASRQATVRHDPVLRHTELVHVAPSHLAEQVRPSTDDARVPLPTVSVLLSSRRPEELVGLLPTLGHQTYPAYELVVGTHGFRLDPATEERLRESLPVRLRVVPASAEEPFGAVLGRLSRVADGELLAKVDDDDHYGRQHLTDLVVGWRTSGADLVGKGSRFMHLPEQDLTVERMWPAPEVDDSTVAGGTMLVPRRTLLAVGGWSEAPRHVDTHLVQRLRMAGGVTRRIHGLDYVYVRRTTGHTWQADIAELVSQGRATYAGLPALIVER